jgi:chemotaxis protein CheD
MSHITSYAEHLPASPVLHLRQGEYFISGSRPVPVRTVLGSCVAVTMHAPDLEFGVMSHGVLPHRGTKSGAGSGRRPGYFVDSSTELLYAEMLRAGADPARIEVKAFGGANVLCPGEGEDGFRVGGEECPGRQGGAVSPGAGGIQAGRGRPQGTQNRV